MKLYSWNINGIRAVLRKGDFQKFLAKHDPDILCLQETKAMRDQAELDVPQYHEYWNSAERKGHFGTAIFSKVEPLQIINNFPKEIAKKYNLQDSFGDPNTEGRVIAAEFDKFWVVTVYTPNSKGDLSRLKLRHEAWDPAFLEYMKLLESGHLCVSAMQGESEQRTEAVQKGTAKGVAEDSTQQNTTQRCPEKPVLFSGDLNVAHQEIDLARPKENVGKHGFTNEERERFDDFINAGFVDIFRKLHPDKTEAYTWWTHWANARARNVGWRIDYWLASPTLINNIKSANIHPEVLGSDHCPVSIEVDV